MWKTSHKKQSSGEFCIDETRRAISVYRETFCSTIFCTRSIIITSALSAILMLLCSIICDEQNEHVFSILTVCLTVQFRRLTFSNLSDKISMYLTFLLLFFTSEHSNKFEVAIDKLLLQDEKSKMRLIY